MKKNKTTAFNITQLLKESLMHSEDYHRNWTLALYVAVSNALKLPEVKLHYKFNYRQWAVDHNLRSIKASITEDYSTNSLTTTRHTEGIEVAYSQNGDSLIFVLTNQNFPVGLYCSGQGPNRATILTGNFEVNLILSAILADEPSTEQPSFQPVDENLREDEPNILNELTDDQLEKIRVYYELLELIYPFYNEQNNEIRKSFITTHFGAGLFYLPHGVRHWVGKISVSCIMEQIIGANNARRVKDHIYPRKAAVIHLLTTKPDSFEDFLEFYIKKVAPYMLVTPNENIMLINYYQEFDRYQDALENRGIQEFPTNDQIFNSTRELNSFIEFCQGRVNENTENVLHVLQEIYSEFMEL